VTQRHPVEIERRAEARVLRVTWNDGHVSEYPFAYLRGWCPCAGCQGHGGERRFVHAPSDLARVTLAGRYAITPVWADGHETGLYTYAYLRELCPCATCTAELAGLRK
jgi:DUF971 family protein